MSYVRHSLSHEYTHAYAHAYSQRNLCNLHFLSGKMRACGAAAVLEDFRTARRACLAALNGMMRVVQQNVRISMGCVCSHDDRS
jgi:hypothetical protein